MKLGRSFWRPLPAGRSDRPQAAPADPTTARLLDREQRMAARRRTHLRSAKLIDAANAFLCEALVQDLSQSGMRLRLARNIGLPLRFGVHDDDSGALYTVSQAWRRGLTVGLRIHEVGPPSPMRRGDKARLEGRYYEVRD